MTGVLLAGGRARRMGGTDKGLIDLAGRPLAAHALARLVPQVGRVVINANRNRAAYGELGAEVVPDSLAGYLGPLAGLLAGMETARTPWVVTAPCDSPFVPVDLVARLEAARAGAGARIAVAHDGERRQPVFLLAETALAPDLRAWLGDGGRKIDQWFARHAVADADFRDLPEAFRNINTPQERAAVEAELLAAGDEP
ncbi:MAG: molybdenum cofactor guanylyltransferase MobA [Halofilum sp. (in: g-proteobacteria)]|nr:molybdenum cofactor guanylyltransferase MobA [Halofilum sp. (in: g-proteobacteria)]